MVSRFHLFFRESMANFFLRLVYRSKFSQWVNMHPSQELFSRYNLYQFIFETEKLQREINYLEFGVGVGSSLKWWLEKNKDPGSSFIGFDTFAGLPENWDKVPRHTFTTQRKLPQLQDNRCSYEVGYFQDTLFGFLERFRSDRRTVVHIDCDLYSSTLFVLSTLVHKLKKGDIIIFDEFGSIRHPTHEFRAFCDFVSAYNFDYQLIGTSDFYRQIAIKLI